MQEELSEKTYKISKLYDYDTLDLDDLSYLATVAEDFSNATAQKIEEIPAIQQAFDNLFDPTGGKRPALLTEAYQSAALEHCIKYAATIEKSFEEPDPDLQRNLQKQASIEHILYIDLYAKLLTGDSYASADNAIFSMPMLHSLLPKELKTDESQELCRELGAHNIAEIASFKAPMLN